MSYKPLRITAYLGSPVAGSPELPLDGFLYHCALEAVYGPPGALQPRTVPDNVDPDIIPLMRVYSPDGSDWLYHCSFAIWDTYTEGAQYWNKRWDGVHDRLVEGKKSVEFKSGKYKAYHSQMACRHAQRITWYCVGDADAIANLLPNHIGYKRDIGYGHVRRWTIEKIDAMPELMGEQGVLRAIPLTWASEFPIVANMGLHTYRPPYWDHSHATHCFLP